MRQLLQREPVKFILEIVDIYFSRRVARSAAELAYFLILSFFPVFICLNAFVGLLPLETEDLIEAAAPFLPGQAVDILRDYIGYVSQNQSSGMLAAGIIMTLFSSSAAFRALMNIMGDIYERKSFRGLWQILASVIFSILFLITIYLSLVVVLTGEWLFQLIESVLQIDASALFWNWWWMRFFLLFCLVLLFVMVVYRMSAPRGNPPVLTGAVLAAAALVAASVLFSWFIGMSSRYSLVYGSLASVIILLVWLYLCGNILILGNVFNCVWYRRKKAKYQN